ncbi:hypothetical protein [Methylosinus sp. C49]|uniref:hypothetical protein n=1 Tax=Methylosinus sp. C49 TaxID=2699395 RepID=UPI00137B23B7|nr:hypothetical protein [Methylosinus sp. C49]
MNQMNSIESKTGSEFDAIWAVRASAELLALNRIISLAIIPVCFIGFLNIQDLMSGRVPPVGPSAVVVVGFFVVYALSVRILGRRTVYVGIQRGICVCYCKILGGNHMVTKYTSDFIEYSRIKKVKLLNVLGKNIIVFEQDHDSKPVRLSADGAPFGSVRQYRNLTIALNSAGIWSGSSKSADSAEENLVSRFIEKTSENISIFKFVYSSVWISGGIFCDEQATKFVIARILRSDSRRYGQ